MGGLYDKGILGSSDNIMALSFIQKGVSVGLNKDNSDNYKKSVLDFERRVKHLRVGYIPGVIRHYYHGSKTNRQYGERWKILVKYQYSPDIHVTYDKQGILVPTDDCPLELLDEIYDYFQGRNEDDIYKDKNIKEILLKMNKYDEEEEEEEEEEDDPANMSQQVGKALANLLLFRGRSGSLKKLNF